MTQRKSRAIPEQAKMGPIDLKNYSFRAEAHCALKSPGRQGAHPAIKAGSKEFWLWNEYFDRWLGGRPFVFKMLLDAEPGAREMTVPEAEPQWFDPSFQPTPNWRPSA